MKSVIFLQDLFLTSSIFVLCWNLGLSQSYTGSVFVAPVGLPRIRILEFSETNPDDGAKIVEKPPNSELTVGDDVAVGSKILLECSATYPVDWVYIGDGSPAPTFDMNSSATAIPVKSKSDLKKPHDQDSIGLGIAVDSDSEASFAYSYAALGFRNQLIGRDTGNYTCRHFLNPEISSYVYIYVPGTSLFVSADERATDLTEKLGDSNLTFRTGIITASTVKIPCSVTNPKATVSLQKSVHGILMPCSLPMTDAMYYHPSSGFHLRYSNLCDVAGTYVCTASFNDTFQIMKHTLKTEKKCTYPDMDLTLKSNDNKNVILKEKTSCDEFKCGHNALCRSINGEPICRCYHNFAGDPYKECRHIHSAFFFHYDDPCMPEIAEEICGPNSICKNMEGVPVCSCHSDFGGDPPACHPKVCSDSANCPEGQTCINDQCSDPCPASCGINSECAVINHVPVCSCKPGYTGDPSSVCCLPDETGDYPCRPINCKMESDCPEDRSCRQGRCKDPCYGARCAQNAVCKPLKHRPTCTCEAGLTGDPYGSACKEYSATDTTTTSTPAPSNEALSIIIEPEIEPTSEPSTTTTKAPTTTTATPTRPRPDLRPLTLCDIRNPCAAEAICRVIASTPICKCPIGFYGNPYYKCYNGLPHIPAIYDQGNDVNATSDPCQQIPYPCGLGAECQVIEGMTACRCPQNTVGDPLVVCNPLLPMSMLPHHMFQIIPIQPQVTPFTKKHKLPEKANGTVTFTKIGTGNSSNVDNSTGASLNACNPPPCGQYSTCRIFNDMPLCSCVAGYTWMSSTCQPTPPTTESYFTCLGNSDCPSGEICRSNQCIIAKYHTKPKEVCEPNPCGPHSSCRVHEVTHRPICQCKYTKYGGAPPRCKPECIVDADCPESKICDQGGLCFEGSRY